MRGLLSTGEAAGFLGVCVNTIRNWEKAGRLVPQGRTLGGHRRYAPDALRALRGDAVPPPTDLTVAYARVSSHDQKEDLIRQGERLLIECERRGLSAVELISDPGSGLNFNKRGLRRLLGLILRGQVARLMVLHKDRLLRFGAELVFEMCHVFRVEVIVVEPAPDEVMARLAADVIELMTVFSARMYGARSHRNRRAAA